jgi:hypothetical protein
MFTDLDITLLPQGWELSAVIRHRLAVGSEPPYDWEVRAENEAQDIATGIESTQIAALHSCCEAIETGLIQRKYRSKPALIAAASDILSLMGIGRKGQEQVKRRQIP